MAHFERPDQRVAPMGPPHAAQPALRASTRGVRRATWPAHRVVDTKERGRRDSPAPFRANRDDDW